MLGIFALSAALKETDLDKYQAGLALLQSNNIDYLKASNLDAKEIIFPGADYFCAGTVEQRIEAIQGLSTDTLLSLKGGYGVQQCLAKLDTRKFKNTRIFAYSDLTALFLKLQDDESIKLFHSPMLVELSSLSEKEFTSFKSFLVNTSLVDIKASLLELTLGLETRLKESNSLFLNNRSYVWGGNLTLLLSANLKPTIKEGYKKVLFIEECFEEAYKVERMLYAARNQGLFDDIDELWLGESKEALVNEVLLDEFAKEYNFNLVKALPFGHSQKFTLPIFRYYD